MSEILLVEDDQTLGLALGIELRHAGHKVTWAQNLSQAQQFTRNQNFELVILDLGLPDGDGLDFCASIRRGGDNTPILILTARHTVDDRVAGLRGGADDYITKPFDNIELEARVDALLRRSQWIDQGQEVLIGKLRLEMNQRRAWDGDEEVPLTELEFKLLEYLLKCNGDAVSRDDLLRRVWGLSDSVQTRTVDMFVSRLRKLLELDPSQPKHLVSVRGVGYRLIN
jgi:DNA-binding response OmpR family regulator